MGAPKEFQCRTGIYGKMEGTSNGKTTMRDSLAESQLISSAKADFTALSRVLSDVQGACDALPQDEQESYRTAQQSVVDARRSAETHEGLLQVC